MARIKIKLKDGRTGSIDDSEFDPTLMDKIEAPVVDATAQQNQTLTQQTSNTQTSQTPPQEPEKSKETALVGGINDTFILGGLLSGLTKYGQFVGGAGEQALKAPVVQNDINAIEKNNADMRQKGAILEQAKKLVELRKTNPNASIEDLQNPEVMKALERNRNYSENASAFYTNDEIKNKLGSPADIAMTGAKGIAGASSYVIPGGAGWIGKGGAALGRGALMGFGDSEKGNEFASTGLGALTSLGFQGLTSGAGKSVNKATDKISENLLNLTPGQRTTFEKNFKIDPVNVAKKFGIVKGGVDDVEKVLKPLNDQYDDLAIKSGKDVLVTDVLAAFDKAKAELKNIPSGKREKLAKAIEKEGELFLGKYGNQKTLPISELTLLRRAVDEGIPGAKFAKGTALQNNVDGLLRTIYKGQIDKATDGATASLGQDISKLIGLKELVFKRKYSPIQGLMRTLGVDATGATIGAGVGYSQGRDLSSAVAGGATGLALTAGANSRTGQQALLKILQNANKTGAGINKVTGGTDRAMQFLGGKLGGEIANLAGRQSPPKNNEGNDTNAKGDNHTNIIDPNVNTMGQTTTTQDKTVPVNEGTPFEKQRGLAPGTGIDELLAAKQRALSAGDKKAVTALDNMLSDEYKYIEFRESQNPTSKPLSAAAAKDLSRNQTAIRNIDEMESILLGDKTTGTKGDLSQILLSTLPGSLGARDYRNKWGAIIDTIGTNRTGAAYTSDQRKDYKYMLPMIGDSEETVKNKMKAIRLEIQDYLANLPNASVSDTITQ